MLWCCLAGMVWYLIYTVRYGRSRCLAWNTAVGFAWFGFTRCDGSVRRGALHTSGRVMGGVVRYWYHRSVGMTTAEVYRRSARIIVLCVFFLILPPYVVVSDNIHTFSAWISFWCLLAAANHALPPPPLRQRHIPCSISPLPLTACARRSTAAWRHWSDAWRQPRPL